MNVLWRLARYVGLYRKEAALSAVMALAVAALNFAQIPALIPIFTGIFGGEEDMAAMMRWPDDVAEYVPSLRQPLADLIGWMVNVDNRVAAVGWALLIVVVLGLIKGFAAFLQEYSAGKVHTGVARSLGADLYRHMLGLSMSFYNRVGSASSTARFTNDIEAVRQGLAFIFNKVLLEPVRLVGFLVIAALMSWQLLLFNLALFPLLAIGVRALGQKAKRATRKGLHSRDRLQNILQESFEGVSIVKAFNMEEHEQGRFQEENQRVRAQDLKIAKTNAISSPFIEIMGIMGIALSMFAAVYYGKLPPVGFVVFYGALAAVADPLRKLSNLNPRLQSLVAAATRVFEFLDVRPDVVERPGAGVMPAFSSEIRLDNVCFSYNGSEQVLCGVDLVARKGEIVALVGPSGAGKSTIARLVPRFYDPLSGAVMIGGVDIREYSLRSLRDQIGLVTQEVILFNDTIAANIAYGRPGATSEEIEAAARKANAHDFISALPEGYGSVIGEKGLNLSGGQRQRIALARAVIKDPPILILDEATSSLDSESEFLIQKALDEFMKDRTSLVIAHRLSTVEKASRIHLVSGGVIAASGTNAELLDRSPVYKRLYSRQFRLAEA